VLAGLVALDATLATWGAFFPGAWFRLFHGAAYVDPQGLLRRCAANWLAFSVLQSVAAASWRKSPWWLMLIAGCRLGDALTDVTCLMVCQSATVMAWVAFPVAGAGNVAVGVWLARTFLRMAPGAER
jgi:hypothetical protein